MFIKLVIYICSIYKTINVTNNDTLIESTFNCKKTNTMNLIEKKVKYDIIYM